ncbi:hypothetical protein [Thalassovita sp.]|uniref:hypothetical protein n=1 Tax=Thalassovita sp. TaxID=1979401 RepID=UPI0029DE74AE|nr:hypothetical protein [Thalassovita sp.]
MVGWLLGCMRPNGPYPLLILTGEQGSAKSTTSKVLLAFDNPSKIKPAMADPLCRLATGGGFAKRKLHSDADEVLFDATRPVILNGIPDLADLSDRAIALHLPTIRATERTFESDFWARFEEAQPRILAVLLDAASHALGRLSHVTLSEHPRIAGFARWVAALLRAHGVSVTMRGKARTGGGSST